MAEEAAPPDDATVALAGRMLDEVRSEVERADQKASLLIGSLGIAFSVILGALIGGDWTLDTLRPLARVLWIAGGIIVVLSVLASAMAVWPRLTKAPSDVTITFWGHVRGFRSHRELADALAVRGLHEPERTFQQLHVLSAVVQRKYRFIRWSMVLAAAGFVLIGAGFLIGV